MTNSDKKIFQRLAKSKGGPILYTTDEGNKISFGELYAALDELYLSVNGARQLLETIEPDLNNTRESSYILMAKLALEYAVQVYELFLPDSDAGGQDFHYGDSGHEIKESQCAA